MSIHHQSSHKDDTYSETQQQHSSYSSSVSQEALSDQHHSNGSNQSFEEYSFHNRKSYNPDGAHPDTQRKNSQFESRCNSQLIRRYSQIYSKLQSLNKMEVIHLFLEELHQNEQYKQRITQADLNAKRMQLQINQLKELLDSKRAAIRKLCETQTNNLNLIECLQQGRCNINWNAHFKAKYQQLQACMNEYISNTKQAQEEFTRTYKILKADNLSLWQINERTQRQQMQSKRLLKLAQISLAKCLHSLNNLQQQQISCKNDHSRLKKQNAQLHSQIQQLREKLRLNQQQFCIEAKQNKQISSSLEFIREKINSNVYSSQSNDIQIIIRQRQQLLLLLSNIVTNSECMLKEKQQMQGQHKQLIQQLQAKNQLLQTLQQQLTLFHGHHVSGISQSLSSKSRFEASRGEYSRIDPNSSFIDTSSFAERLIVGSNNYKELF